MFGAELIKESVTKLFFSLIIPAYYPFSGEGANNLARNIGR
jgi:hypothetical protein